MRINVIVVLTLLFGSVAALWILRLETSAQATVSSGKDVKVVSCGAKPAEIGEWVVAADGKQVWRKTGDADGRIDKAGTARLLEEAVKTLVSDGYTISQIVPVTDGYYRWERNQWDGWGLGYGWSQTGGYLVVGVR